LDGKFRTGRVACLVWPFTVYAGRGKICPGTGNVLFVGLVAAVKATGVTFALGFGMAVSETGGALNRFRDERKYLVPDHI